MASLPYERHHGAQPPKFGGAQPQSSPRHSGKLWLQLGRIIRPSAWRSRLFMLVRMSLVIWIPYCVVFVLRHHFGWFESSPWGPMAQHCDPECPVLIAGVASDTGAWNTIRPVIVAALELHQPTTLIILHLSGACARLFQQGRLEVDPRISVFVDMDLASLVRHRHDITVVGASASEAGTASGAAALCSSAATQTIGLLEDRYSTSMRTLESYQRLCPDRSKRLEADAECSSAAEGVPCLFIALADRIAREQVRRFTSYKGSLVITGSPHYDAAIKGQQEAAKSGHSWLEKEREGVRKALGIGQTDFVVFLAGQPVGDDEVLGVVVQGLKRAKLDQKVRILCRHHPRQGPEEKERYMSVLETSAPPEWFSIPESVLEAFGSSEDLIASADIVISGYSSTNYYAMMVGITGTVYAHVPALVERFMHDKKLDAVPEVAAGAGWSVGNAEDFEQVVRNVLNPDSAALAGHKQMQKKLCEYHDGHATERILDKLMEQQRAYGHNPR